MERLLDVTRVGASTVADGLSAAPESDLGLATARVRGASGSAASGESILGVMASDELREEQEMEQMEARLQEIQLELVQADMALIQAFLTGDQGEIQAVQGEIQELMSEYTQLLGIPAPSENKGASDQGAGAAPVSGLGGAPTYADGGTPSYGAGDAGHGGGSAGGGGGVSRSGGGGGGSLGSGGASSVESSGAGSDGGATTATQAAGSTPEVSHQASTGNSIKGLDPLASDALRKAGLNADDVSQGFGDAAASKGTHLREPGSKYTAAVDIRTGGRSPQEIRKILEKLGEQGFAAWYRHGTGWSGNEHIHAVYAGVPLKDSLERQVQDFIHGRNGLASHSMETGTYGPSARSRQVVAALYARRSQHVAVS